MIRAGRFEKWASGFLGVVCVLLVLNLALRSGARVGASRSPVRAVPAAEPPRPQSVSAQGRDELARHDPVVRLDLLKDLRSRPLPRLDRNPFEFEAPRPAVPASEGAAPPTPTTATPAGPPPVSLKALGYTEKSGGVPEAIISDDEQLHIVHEGEVFAKRFRVLKITPKLVEIDDEAAHQTVRLPIAP